MKKYIIPGLLLILVILGILSIKNHWFYKKSERFYEVTRSRSFDNIMHSKTLIVGTTINPISFYFYKETKAGFEYEIAKHIAKKLKLNLEIINVANDSILYSMIHKGQIDMAMNHFLSIEDQYSKDFAYTTDIMKTHVSMLSFSHNDSSEDDWSKKLKYAKIYIPSNDFEHMPKDYLIKLLPKTGKIIFDDTSSSFGLMKSLANSDSTILITWDYLYELSNLDEFTHIRMQEIAVDNQMTFILAAGQTTLLDTINSITEDFKKTDKYRQICKRYLSNQELLTIDENLRQPAGDKPLKYKKGAISIYDEIFKKYAKMNKLDWKLVAAIVQKESGFNPMAESPYGASGLMQLMPETGKRFGADSLFNPEQNIKAGCAYLKYLSSYWNKKVSDSSQVHYFIIASYNSGQGHIIDAQKLAEKYGANPNVWFGNVELYLNLKADPKYYKDPVCKLGYCKAYETIAFVKNVSAKHLYYQQTVK